VLFVNRDMLNEYKPTNIQLRNHKVNSTANKVVLPIVSQKQQENITLLAVHVGPTTFDSV